MIQKKQKSIVINRDISEVSPIEKEQTGDRNLGGYAFTEIGFQLLSKIRREKWLKVHLPGNHSKFLEHHQAEAEMLGLKFKVQDLT